MNIHKELILRADKSLVRCLEKELPKSDYDYMFVYTGRGLQVTSKNYSEDTRLYIRICFIKDYIAIDMSNISLDPRIQHKGKLTSIINSMKRSRSFKEIWFSSVLTPEMHNACIKFGMTYDDSIMGYKFKM